MGAPSRTPPGVVKSRPGGRFAAGEGPCRHTSIGTKAATMSDSLQDLSRLLAQFAREREWEPFHSPKNLSSALIVEAGELLEHFQWMTEQQSRQLEADKLGAVGAEMADVLLYLIQLANATGIDLVAAAHAKLRANEARYPVARSRGNSRKHDEL
jgi:dCTP diphosphatase